MHVRFFSRELCAIVVIEKPNMAQASSNQCIVEANRIFLKSPLQVLDTRESDGPDTNTGHLGLFLLPAGTSACYRSGAGACF